MLRDKYGGVEAYLKDHAGLTETDFALIRQNVIVPK